MKQPPLTVYPTGTLYSFELAYTPAVWPSAKYSGTIAVEGVEFASQARVVAVAGNCYLDNCVGATPPVRMVPVSQWSIRFAPENTNASNPFGHANISTPQANATATNAQKVELLKDNGQMQFVTPVQMRSIEIVCEASWDQDFTDGTIKWNIYLWTV